MSKIETTSKVSLKLTSRINRRKPSSRLWTQLTSCFHPEWSISRKIRFHHGKTRLPWQKNRTWLPIAGKYPPAKINSPKPQSWPPKAAKAPKKSILSPLDRKQASTIRNEEPRQKLPPVAAIFEKKYKKIVFTSQKLSFCSWNKALY